MLLRSFVLLLAIVMSGCVSSSGSRSGGEDSGWTINPAPLIGLIGLAVDGDDKDDYDGFFEDDCCCDH